MAMVAAGDGTNPDGIVQEPEIVLSDEEMAERQRELEALLADEESSDEDSVPDPPLFDLELKWFRIYANKEDERVPYTKTKCVVKVRITDTVGDLRRKVQEFTQLSKFKLIVSETGEELLQAPDSDDEEEEDEKNEKKKKGEDDDSEGEEEEESDEEAEVNDEYDAIDMSELLGVSIPKKDGEVTDKNILLYDDRLLSMIGIKEPKEEEEEDSDDESLSEKKEEEEKRTEPNKNGEQDVKNDNNNGKKKKKNNTIDASFLPRDLPPVAEGKEDNENETNNVDRERKQDKTGPAGGGGGGRNNDNLLDSNLDDLTFDDENVESVTIEIEEFDDTLDSRMFVKQESSEVLYQRALNAANQKWWERAADGNLDMVKDLWASEVRKELMQVDIAYGDIW